MSENAVVEQAGNEQSVTATDPSSPGKKMVEFVELLPPALKSIFGGSRTQRGEDPAARKALLDGFATQIQPANLMEDMWVFDLTDLTWRIQCYRRVQATSYQAAERATLRAVFRRQINTLRNAGMKIDLDPIQASRDWYVNPQLREEHEEIGITEEHLADETLFRNYEEAERIEKMIAGIERRRDRIFHQMENHRDKAAHRARAMELARRSDQAAKNSGPVPLSASDADPLKDVLDAFKAQLESRKSQM